MQVTAMKDHPLAFQRPSKARRRRFVTSFPPTHAETALASVQWERRGLLGRLVQVAESVES